MSTTPARRRARTRTTVLGLATALTLAIATARPVGATPTLNPSGFRVHLDDVEISGTAPTGAEEFAVAQCKVQAPNQPGERCHLATALAPAPVMSGQYFIASFTLHDSWEPDYDLTGESPTPVAESGTWCAGLGSDACYVVVFYDEYGELMWSEQAGLEFI